MAAITQVRILVTAFFTRLFLQKRQKVKDALDKYGLTLAGKIPSLGSDSCIHSIFVCMQKWQ